MALEQRLGHVHVLLMPPGISPVDNCRLLNTVLATDRESRQLVVSASFIWPVDICSNSLHVHVVLTKVDRE